MNNDSGEVLRSEIAHTMTLDIIRYSQVWEDQQVLCEGLAIGPEDDVLSIASAGCNVLALLLAGARSVTAIDMSPAQIALLELKLAGIRLLSHDIFVGFILIYNPGLTALVVSFMIGFWFLFYGITSLTDSFGLKDEGISNWWVGLLWGILAIIFGFWIMFRPFAGALTIVVLLGTFFMIAGIFNVGFSFVLKGIKKETDSEV